MRRRLDLSTERGPDRSGPLLVWLDGTIRAPVVRYSIGGTSPAGCRRGVEARWPAPSKARNSTVTPTATSTLSATPAVAAALRILGIVSGVPEVVDMVRVLRAAPGLVSASLLSCVGFGGRGVG